MINYDEEFSWKTLILLSLHAVFVDWKFIIKLNKIHIFSREIRQVIAGSLSTCGLLVKFHRWFKWIFWMFNRERLKLWGRKSRSNVHGCSDSVFNSSGGVIVESCWIKINVQRAACFLSVTSLIDRNQLCYCSIPSKELHEKEIMMWLKMFWRHFIIYFAR